MARTRTKTNRLLRKRKAAKAAKAAVSPLASDPLVDFLTGVAKTERRQMHYEKEMERANTEIAFLREELTKLAESTYDQITRLQDASGGIWKMRDGTLIAIRDMSDSHLANSLKLVQTNPPSIGSQGWISLFEKEIERRRVDREWARKTGHAPTPLDVRFQAATALATIRRLSGDFQIINIALQLEKLLDRVLP